MMMIDKEELKLNVELQKKKNQLRKELSKRGVLERKGENKFDRYKYFSEAQYKELFTELLPKFQLELNVVETDRQNFEGTQKQPFGRTVRLQITLIDAETGYFETSAVSGEGMDKGDKAIYKAYTGAIKYFLANTFLVATGDDPEATSKYDDDNSKPKTIETPTFRNQFILFAKEHNLDFEELSVKYDLNKKSTELDFKKALESEAEELEKTRKNSKDQQTFDDIVKLAEGL